MAMHDEELRLAELARYEILDSPAEANFDRIVTILLSAFDVDFALITFVDTDRCWYKSEQGLGVSEMPRSDNMCDVVIRQDGVLAVEDATAADPDMVAPLLRMGLRFYIGAPVRSSAGIKVGTVCAVGARPHVVSEAQRAIVESLAGIVSEELEMRLAAKRLAEADEALRAVNRQLEDANRNKSDFLASMSHELRTPLNGILGASELLEQELFGRLNEKQAEYVHDINRTGHHLLSLINDVLDLSKVEAGQLSLQRESLDLHAFMEGCASVVRAYVATKRLSLNVVPPPEPVAFDADERRLKQVACNLLSNAVKFTPEGGAVRFQAEAGDGSVTFHVTDEGPGIPAEYHDRIFEQFFRLSNDHEGTGLGLPVARQLVELHGGSIWMESGPGAGSQFSFAIPKNAPEPRN